MFKNVATKIALFVFDSVTNQPKTGDAVNLSVYVTKDYGSATILADTSATEMDATNNKGMYVFDVAQAESNADALIFSGKSSTTGIVVSPEYIFTTPANFSTLAVDSSGNLTGTVGGFNTAGELQLGVIDDGTAQLATATTLQLRAGATFGTSDIVGSAVLITGATLGVGQARVITAYNGATDTATVDAWTTTPTGTITYKVFSTPPVSTTNPPAVVLAASGHSAFTESYAADGAAATLPQLLYQIWSLLAEARLSGTTITTKKLDGSTNSMTFTLDSGTAPTTITRAS